MSDRTSDLDAQADLARELVDNGHTRLAARPGDTLALTVENVTKVFGAGPRAVTALENVSLEVTEGEFVSLVGPSGCGKTTLLRIVGGLTEVSNGKVAVLPRPDGRLRRLSFVFQDVNLLPWRSVLRNVEFGLESRADVDKRERRERAMDALRRVDLDRVAYAPPYTLSGGMQQRVGLARALAVQPDVLLMDEPFGALDNFTREGLQHQLAQLWEELKLTILFVTHDIDEAIFLSSEIALFQSQPGRMVSRVAVPLPPQRWTYDVRSEPDAVELHRVIRFTLAGSVSRDSRGGV
jgi:NitT/TauT family transport system ATP-binding protein